jgi:hypothetical protein
MSLQKVVYKSQATSRQSQGALFDGKAVVPVVKWAAERFPREWKCSGARKQRKEISC